MNWRPLRQKVAEEELTQQPSLGKHFTAESAEGAEKQSVWQASLE